jgi:hypothetical protein
MLDTEDDDMTESYSLSRNTTEGFARRVRENLEFIIEERALGKDAHEITQLVTSLLGIIVFPWEAGALSCLDGLRLIDLEKEGWPKWDISLDKKGDTGTLGKLTWHLRNAASHRRLRFSSDDREMSKVDIVFEDAPNDKPVNWRAKINAGDLKVFCDRFTKQLEDLVG